MPFNMIRQYYIFHFWNYIWTCYNSRHVNYLWQIKHIMSRLQFHSQKKKALSLGWHPKRKQELRKNQGMKHIFQSVHLFYFCLLICMYRTRPEIIYSQQYCHAQLNTKGPFENWNFFEISETYNSKDVLPFQVFCCNMKF